MDTGLRDYRLRLELSWRLIAKSRVVSLPIVEHFDVFEDVLRGFISGGIVPMVHELPLERPEEAFDAGIVPAVAFTAHAGTEAIGCKDALVARRRP